MNIQYKTVRSFRRSVAIQIHPEKGVIVRAPRFLSERKIEKFLKEKEKWIHKHMEEFKKKNDTKRVLKFEKGNTYPFLGDDISLPFYTKTEVIDWYKKQATKIFTERTGFYSAILSEIMNKKITPKEVQIKSYKSRWGACTKDNKIIYNWRAIMAPQSVIDYLIVHELCHIIHKNHARQFYTLVSKLDPNYKEHKKYLRTEMNISFENL